MLHAKDYYEHQLPDGMNFYEFFGIPSPKVNKGGHKVRPQAAPETHIITLQGLDEHIEPEPDNETRVIRWRGENMTKPLVKTYLRDMDSGNVYTHDHEGNQRPAAPTEDELGVEFQVTQRAKAPRQQAPKVGERDQKIATALEHPETFVGTRVLKKFYEDGVDKGDYWGTVQSTYLDGDTDDDNRHLWRIGYDDDDGWDEFDMRDLIHYCIDKFVTPIDWDPSKAYTQDGAPTQSETLATAPEPQSKRDIFRGRADPYAQIPQSDFDITIPRNVVWPPSHVKSSSDGYYVTHEDHFQSMCDKVGIYPHHRKLYMNWLGVHFGPNSQFAPGNTLGARFLVPWEGDSRKRRPKLRNGIRLPIPAGPSWMQYLAEYDRKQSDANGDRVISKLCRAAEGEAMLRAYEMSKAKHEDYHGGSIETVNRAEHSHTDPSTFKQLYERSCDSSYGVTAEQWSAHMQEQGVKVTTADIQPWVDKATGSVREPRGVREALAMPDRKSWQAAIDVELGQMDKLKVFSESMTEEEARARGGVGKPTPLRMLLTYKQTPTGALCRHKGRLVLCGHSRYLQRGRDFFNTYSATPNMATSRVACFLVAQGWKRIAFDITTAYLQAEVKEGEQQIVIPDPPEYDKAGNRLVKLMQKWQYGHPLACKNFIRTRNDFYTGPKFNTGPATALAKIKPVDLAGKVKLGEDGDFHVEQSLADKIWAGIPGHDYWVSRIAANDGSTYLFRHHRKDGSCTKAMMVAFIDDADLVGECQADLDIIRDLTQAQWGIKGCDSEFMLGLVRKISDDGKTVTVSMPGYVENMYREYVTTENGCNKRIPETPMPPDTYITKATVDPTDKDAAARRPLYASVVGSLLWSARNVYCECAVGVNMLCRQMAAPSEEALRCALHMVAYQYGARHQGIRYRRVDAPELVGYYDASNKLDPIDGKAMAGHVIFLGHGPVEWRAQRLPHVGQSAQHNEYMELARATKAAVYLRQFIAEMGFDDWIKDPTVLLGDNDAATKLAREDIVSLGNRFYSKDIHYGKEQQTLGNIDARRVPTDDNLADTCTKCLPGPKIAHLVPTMKGLTEQGIPPAPPAPRD